MEERRARGGERGVGWEMTQAKERAQTDKEAGRVGLGAARDDADEALRFWRRLDLDEVLLLR